MGTKRLNPKDLDIAPLKEGMVAGAFDGIVDSKCYDFIEWFKNDALRSQKERKSRTYVVYFESKIIAYATISMVLKDKNNPLPGFVSTTKFEPQLLLIGRLYTIPKHRSKEVGRELLKYVAAQAKYIDTITGCLGLVVDAKINPKTISFYERNGFIETNRTTKIARMFFMIPSKPVTSPNETLF